MNERKELCNSASCHRCTMALGRCWNHRNLNEATHRQIDRFFGGVSMRLMHVLMRQGVLGVKVAIMLPHDPTGKQGPKRALDDVVTILEPKEDIYRPYVEPTTPVVPSAAPVAAVAVDPVYQPTA